MLDKNPFKKTIQRFFFRYRISSLIKRSFWATGADTRALWTIISKGVLSVIYNYKGWEKFFFLFYPCVLCLYSHSVAWLMSDTWLQPDEVWSDTLLRSGHFFISFHKLFLWVGFVINFGSRVNFGFGKILLNICF